MKLLFDLFPVILFFAAFKYAGSHKEGVAQWLDGLFAAVGLTAGIDPEQAPILLATVVVILATVGQILWVRLRHGKVDKMLWFSLALVVILGSLTLLLRDDSFIKWKPTLLYWVFAATLLVSGLIGKSLVRAMFAEHIQMPDVRWRQLNLVWVGFFALLGALNLVIARNYDTETWVNFKVFGGMGLVLLFMLAQGFWLMRYAEEPAEPAEPAAVADPSDAGGPGTPGV
jgi:intracellular septation protein